MDGDGVAVASVVMNLVALVGAVVAGVIAVRKSRHELSTDERKQQREARDAMVEELRGLITAQRAEMDAINVKVAEEARKTAECEAARSRMEGRLDVLAGLMEEKGIRVPPWPPSPPTPPQSPAGGS